VTNEQTAGTPGQDDGDALEQSATTGTPELDDRDAESSEPDYKALYLASKSKVEEANRLKAEIEALRQREPQPPAAEDDDEPAPIKDDVDWEKVQDYARRGDEVAKAQLANRAMYLELARDVRDSFGLRDIEDKAERKEVLAHFAKNRHRLGDVQAAAAEIRARKLDTEVARLRQELEAVTKQPPRDVVKTHAREVTSSEAKARKMTYEQYDAQIAALESQGKHREARAMGLKVAKGEIELP
jgi:hypothetical protein